MSVTVGVVVTGIYYIETEGTAKHFVVHRTVAWSEILLAGNTKGVVEKPSQVQGQSRAEIPAGRAEQSGNTSAP